MTRHYKCDTIEHFKAMVHGHGLGISREVVIALLDDLYRYSPETNDGICPLICDAIDWFNTYYNGLKQVFHMDAELVIQQIHTQTCTVCRTKSLNFRMHPFQFDDEVELHSCAICKEHICGSFHCYKACCMNCKPCDL